MADVVAQPPPERTREPGFPSARILPRPQSILAVVVVFVVSVVLLRGASYPVVSEPVTLTGDATVAVTADQLQRGITLAVPSIPAGTATAVPTFQQIQPFSVSANPSDTTGTHYATLKVAPPLPAAGQYVAATVEANGATWRLTVIVMPDPFLPVASVVAGLLISYAIGLWENVLSPGLQLQQEAVDLLWMISWVDDHAVGHPMRRADPNDRPGDGQTIDRFSLTRAARAAVLQDPIPPDNSIIALVQRGDLAEARSRLAALQSLFADYRTFLGVAAEVADSYGRIKAKLATTGSIPKALRSWDALFDNPRHEYEIRDADDLKSVSSRVKDLASLYVVFERIDTRIDDGWELSRRISARVSPVPPEIENARASLAEASADLWDAGSIDDIRSWKVEEAVEDALATIRKVAADHHVVGDSPLDQRAAPREAGGQLATPNVLLTRAAAFHATRLWNESLLARDKAGHPGLSTRFELAKSLRDMPRPDSKADRTYQASMLQTRELITMGDVAVLVVAVLVAALTALSSLYEGKVLSSPLEYAALFTWGVGVDQGVKGILGVLGKLGVPTPSSANTTS